ncbi:hypothetical protein [Pseudonocardia sp. NPDC049635]|uniref:hypothetical protein n=1 Tax=Pseudonocardia sp. NPDC049635 TaxID=3155506 RepID=UPI0033F54E4F
MIHMSGRALAWGACTVAVIIALAFIAVYGFGTFRKETAEFRGDVAQNERVTADPNYRIAAHDRFYDLCAAIQSREASITAQRAELDTTDDPARAGQLRQNLTALEASRASAINQYNADARKEGTRAEFRASDLPAEIPQEGPTRCDAS